MCTPTAKPALLSLTLPLLVASMWVPADGAFGEAAQKLSSLAHASFTALAKRYPAEVRAVAAGFDEGTRTRMATSHQEAAGPLAAPPLRAYA